MNRKARVLINMFACVAVLVVLALVGGVAKADNPGGLTCGGRVSYGDATYNAALSNWHIHDTHYCNDGKTYGLELQYNTNAHPLQWHDFGNEYFRNSGNCTNGCNATYNIGNLGCPDPGNTGGSDIHQLRIQWWWQDGSINTVGDGATSVCNGQGILTP